MERSGLARLLGSVSAQGPSRLVVGESDPRKFMAAFARAVGGQGEVFLCDPNWGAHERAQLDALLKTKPETANLKPEDSGSNSGLLPEPPRGHPVQSTSGHGFSMPSSPLGSVRTQVSGLSADPQVSGFRSQLSTQPDRGWLMVPTGGTGGKLKFARHDAATITAAVRGFTRHFGLPQVNAAGVLPLHHVSGLMAWMRCVLTGGEYLPLDWKAVEAGAWPALPDKAHGWTVSLVPTQLERLLRQEDAVTWLRQFRLILLGGAPAWPVLLDRAAELRLPLSPGYGMTETAAMIAALRPEEFLAGARGCGAPLPHVRVGFDEEGTILVGGESVFRGYFPDWREAGDFVTQDGGWLDEHGHLHVAGRRDAVIITGGEKVNPAEVEAVLRGTNEFPDVAVLGVPDAEWGECVVAAYPAAARPDLARVEVALARLLSPAKRPKRFVAVAAWPVNAQGKVNRAEVARHIAAQL